MSHHLRRYRGGRKPRVSGGWPSVPPCTGAATLLVLWLSVAACEPGAAPDTEPLREGAAADAPPRPVRDTVLEAVLRETAAEIEGVVGVAVLHLQRGVHAAVNEDHRFALASVYKLPIAYAAMQGARVAPGDSVTVAPTDRAPGDTPFAPGMAVPVSSLVERSLAHSDNTASDVLLRLAGGPEEVTRRIHSLGARELRVDRSMRRIFVEWRGMDLEGHEAWSAAEFDRRAAAVPAGDRQEAQAAFVRDVRDTGTAGAIVTLLAALHRGDELGPDARQLLLDALRASVTGPTRIRTGVPAGTTVAHKTGTLGPLTHDVGIVSLPAGRGEVALAVLVQSAAPLGARERVIAAATRAVYGHFTAGVDDLLD
jgi:beta-lactamase class A